MQASRAVSVPGFTLVELLVIIVIVSGLAAVAGVGVSKMRAKADMVLEISAAKNLIAAYQLEASENAGKLMPGMDVGVQGVTDIDGRPLTPPHAGERYAYRLAPYFGLKLEGTVLLKKNKEQILDLNDGSSGGMYHYFVSAFPSLGMNAYLVGGYRQQRGKLLRYSYPKECVTRNSQVVDANLLVFASAGTTNGGKKIDGYSMVTAPKLQAGSGLWKGRSSESADDPSRTGNVAFRHAGKAVCAFLDGAVKVLDENELRDMRLWSNEARRQGNKDYVPIP